MLAAGSPRVAQCSWMTTVLFHRSLVIGRRAGIPLRDFVRFGNTGTCRSSHVSYDTRYEYSKLDEFVGCSASLPNSKALHSVLRGTDTGEHWQVAMITQNEAHHELFALSQPRQARVGGRADRRRSSHGHGGNDRQRYAASSNVLWHIVDVLTLSFCDTQQARSSIRLQLLVCEGFPGVSFKSATGWSCCPL